MGSARDRSPSGGPPPQTPTSIGRDAERTARAYLESCGYSVLETNFCCRGGELDLVCEDGEVLSFVEVRSRADERFGSPLETIDRRKRTRIVRAARAFLRARGIGRRAMRFDVVAIVGGQVVALVRDAFRVDDW